MSESNGYVTLEQLGQLSGKRRYRDVSIDNPFGGAQLKFRIRNVTEAEWSEVTADNFDHRRGGLNRAGLAASDAKLVAACVVDGSGNQMFSGKAGVETIRSLDAGIVEPLVRECREWSNLRGTDDAEKNSQPASDLVEN